MSTIRLESVSKEFGRHRVLSSIDLSIGVGERTVLLGPSGAGKTTVLRIIAGLEQPSAGTVWFGQRDVARLSPVKRKVAMVFQDYAVYPQLSVAENLKASLKSSGLPSHESGQRIAETLDWFQLTPYAQRRPAQLSGGQLQRVALAKAVVRRPEVMLLDEPFSQLDAQLREQLRDLLLELHDRLPSTMLIVTHDPLDAMRIAPTVTILDAGRMIATGTCEEVYRQPASRTAANLISPLGVNWLSFQLTDGAVAEDSNRLTKETLLGSRLAQQLHPPLAWNLSQTHVENLLSRMGNGWEGKTVWLGFRPEAVRLDSTDDHKQTAHGLYLRGSVQSVQSLGFARLATIVNERVQIKSLVSLMDATPTGSIAGHVAENDLMWFAATTEEK